MKRKNNDFIECDYCGELFVEGEPFCPCCGKPVKEILEAIKQGNRSKKKRWYEQKPVSALEK